MRKSSGSSSILTPKPRVYLVSPLMISAEHAPNYAALRVASWSKSGSLGHASVQTTERYLGTKQDLVHAPNDAIKLRVAV